MSDEETKKPDGEPQGVEGVEQAGKAPEEGTPPEGERRGVEGVGAEGANGRSSAPEPKKPKAPKEPKAAKPEGAADAEAPVSLDELAEGDKDRVDPKAAKAEREAKKAKVQEEKGTAPPQKAKAKDKGKDKGKDKKKKEGGAKEAFVKRAAPPRLRRLYEQEVVEALMKEFGFKTKMAVPRLVKITVNMGLGQALQNAKLLEAAETEITAIAGQKPVITKARKSIATFKLRQGQKIGCMVTLRKNRMYEFFDRFVSFALPRTRDFKGVSPKSFDGRGNFSIGIREQIIFPEIDYDKIEKIMGLNITIVTSAKSDDEGRALLKHLGMPFRQ
jgi:large subunit ribosomal protein L5